MSNPIRAFLASLETQREHDRQAYADPPEQPDWTQEASQYRLQWKPSQLPPLEEPLPLEEVRSGITRQIMLYATNQDDASLLLIRVPPGTGKTTAAVNAVQYLGESKRILYAAGRHDFYADICGVRGYKPAQWYEWKAFKHTDSEGEPDMCRFSDQLDAWVNRGYPSVLFCKQVCLRDKHMSQCPYRLQRGQKEPIIFGMHQHLITGMSISDYALGICDEMPLTAFLDRRNVPESGILVPGASGVVEQLFRRLLQIARTATDPVYGPRLLGMIGDLLGQAYQEIDKLEAALPLAPEIVTAQEAYDAPYWYVFDLLKALSSEYECYRNGWQNWVSRVRVSQDGILILSRKHTKMAWRREFKPRKLVVLDATGSAEMYRRIFERPVREYAPQVERPGRVFQVVGRLNGMSSSLGQTQKKGVKRLSKNGRQMLKAADLIAAQYEGRVAAVTFKSAETEFMDVFGEENVRHFGALRGTNDLEGAEALIVAGGYCPPMAGVFDLAASLNPERMIPFMQEVDGRAESCWSKRLVEYRMREQKRKGAPWRNVSGFWRDADLSVILEELRRNEIVQAVHRVRPNLKASDVWLLTSVPTNEPLDGIYEDLSEVEFTPERAKEQRTTKTGKTYDKWKGVAWGPWLLLWRWLDRKWDEGVPYLTKEDLAIQANVTSKTVVVQGWMDALDAFYKDKERHWVKETRRINNRRQGTFILVPVKD